MMAEGMMIGEQIPSRDIAMEALRISHEAKNMISSHERVCTERWTESKQVSQELKEKVDRIHWAMLGSLVWLFTSSIGVLAMVLWYILTRSH